LSSVLKRLSVRSRLRNSTSSEAKFVRCTPSGSATSEGLMSGLYFHRVALFRTIQSHPRNRIFDFDPNRRPGIFIVRHERTVL
jgi:hypothetical protein